MSSAMKLCMSCMEPVPPEALRCPHCGFNGKQSNEKGGLPIGYRLGSRYVVGMQIERDAVSVGYVGYDTTLSKKVNIREFFPQVDCARDGETQMLNPEAGTELFYKTALMDFCDLYKNLHKIEGQDSLIRVSDFLETNNTGYAILDPFEGITLREFLSLAGGAISAENALKIVHPVVKAVGAMHTTNLIHRGISPETIFVNRNGDIKLGGVATSMTRTKGTEVDAKLFAGYAAPEQYATSAFQSTATDTYALAAVFYRCVSGQTPQDAEHRRNYDTVEPLTKVNSEISSRLSRVVAVSMLINAEARTQTGEDFLAMLQDALLHPDAEERTMEIAVKESAERDSDITAALDDEEAENRKRRQRMHVIVGMAVGVVALVLVMIFVVWPLLGLSVVPNDEQGEDPNAAAHTMLEVPSYVGKISTEVTLDEGNFVYQYVYTSDANQPGNMILDQEPVPGTLVEKGTSIILTLNEGVRVSMPGVVGMMAEQAKGELDYLGIIYRIVEKETTDYVGGVVIEQSIAEGTRINPETRRVTLTVAKAPPAAVAPPPAEEGALEATP